MDRVEDICDKVRSEFRRGKISPLFYTLFSPQMESMNFATKQLDISANNKRSTKNKQSTINALYNT